MFRVLAAVILALLVPVSGLALEQVDLVWELPFRGPTAVAADKDWIYVGDEDGGLHALREDGSVVFSISGKSRDERSRMERPVGLAAYEGNIYVVDSSAGKVLIFSRDGRFIDSFGAYGSAPGEFKDPQGVFVYRGVIYVADTGNSRVQIFSPDGIYMGSMTGLPATHQEFKDPVDVAVAHNGNIYVLDAGLGMVQVYLPSRKHYTNITGFKEPSALAMDVNGFYVADRDYKVKKYGLKGNPMFSFGTEGKGRAQFRRISGLSVNAEGGVLATDLKKGTIQMFSTGTRGADSMPYYAPAPPSARWIKDIAIENAGKLHWDGKGTLYAIDDRREEIVVIKEDYTRKSIKIDKVRPVAVASDPDGYLWVIDGKSNRLIKTDENGNVFMVVGSSGRKEGQLSDPTDIEISKRGFVYVSDKGNSRVQVFNKSGLFASVIGKKGAESFLQSPGAIALDGADNLYVIDDGKKTVSKFSPEGRPLALLGGKGKGPGEFETPVDVIAENDEVYVLDRERNTIQIFGADGKFRRELGSRGSGRGGFSEPVSLAMRDGIELLVSDTGNKRVQAIRVLYTPRAPLNLKAEGGMMQVGVSWAQMDAFADAFRIYRSYSPDRGFKEIGTSKTKSYTDVEVEPGKTYFYRVSAVARLGNEGAMSDAADGRANRYAASAPKGLKATPSAGEVALEWQPNPESFISHYVVYREAEGVFAPIEKVRTPSFTDSSVKPDAKYTYKVTAVTADGDESPGSVVKTTTHADTRPPVEISVLDMQDVFAGSYRNYEADGLGRLGVRNNTRNVMLRPSVSFFVKEFMDFPADTELADIPPGKEAEAVIRPVFNSRLLGLSENVPALVEIKLAYFDGREMKTFTRSHPIRIYEKHQLSRDVPERAGAFVTPRDEAVLEFAKDLAAEYRDIPEPLIYGRGIFAAMGVIGISHMPDPSQPGKTGKTDYVQYPQETLRRKSGDAEDIAYLYASALEALGVRTALLYYPGGSATGALIMFSTGMKASEADEDYVAHEGVLWVPVEPTMVGSPFLKAWEKGMENYRAWRGRGLRMLDVRKAWERFKPAALPPSGWQAGAVRRVDMESRFRGELDYLKKLRIKYLSRGHLASLAKNPKDADAANKLGVVYGESGEAQEAINLFKKAIALAPKNAAPKNNLGNALYLLGKYKEALKAYEEAMKADPGDPYISVNAARCYLRLGNKAKAKEAFDRAGRQDRDVPRTYAGLAGEIAAAGKKTKGAVTVSETDALYWKGK